MWYRGEHSTHPGIQAAFGAGAALYAQQPEAPVAVKHAVAERLLLVFPDAHPQIVYGAVALGFVKARATAQQMLRERRRRRERRLLRR